MKHEFRDANVEDPTPMPGGVYVNSGGEVRILQQVSGAWVAHDPSGLDVTCGLISKPEIVKMMSEHGWVYRPNATLVVQ